MPTLNDDEFEKYLKQFRALESEPLPSPHTQPTRGVLVFAAWAAVTAAILVAAAWIRQPRHEPAISDANPRVDEQLATQLPLTIGTANNLLAGSSSFKATLDRMALQPRSAQVPKGKRSAIALLSQENTHL